jgi:hypothetical protein
MHKVPTLLFIVAAALIGWALYHSFGDRVLALYIPAAVFCIVSMVDRRNRRKSSPE